MWYDVLIPLAMFISGVVGIVSWLYFGAKTADRMGVAAEMVKLEDAKTAAEMMLDFLSNSMEGLDRRHNECTKAGCDGYDVMRGSLEIAKAVMCAHRMGGRLVLRKKADRDIENPANAVLDVSKILSEMDIARAKIIRRKYRR